MSRSFSFYPTLLFVFVIFVRMLETLDCRSPRERRTLWIAPLQFRCFRRFYRPTVLVVRFTRRETTAIFNDPEAREKQETSNGGIKQDAEAITRAAWSV